MQLSIGLRNIAVRTKISNPLYHHRLLSTSSLLHSATSSSNSSSNSSPSGAQSSQDQQNNAKQQQSHKKTMAELDEELRQKLEGMSGEGGAAGIELENGKPVAMKRGVRENMFRLI